MPLLSWGVTSGAFGEDEILELLESVRPEDDPEDLLERLLKAGLVFERGLAGNQFRTRMAETVRPGPTPEAVVPRPPERLAHGQDARLGYALPRPPTRRSPPTGRRSRS